MIASVATVFIVLRVIQMYAPAMPQLSNFQIKQAHKYERFVQWIGIIFLGAGVIVFSSTVIEFLTSRARHPLVVLLTTLYHTSIGTTLIIVPLYQVTVSRMLLKNPLICVSLVMINAVRFIDVLTQLDYRSIGETANLSWRLHNTVEIAALGAHFVTIMLCLRIAELVNGTIFSEAMMSFEGFNNPLSIDAEIPEWISIKFRFKIAVCNRLSSLSNDYTPIVNSSTLPRTGAVGAVPVPSELFVGFELNKIVAHNVHVQQINNRGEKIASVSCCFIMLI
ncbi:unnamed protein product [Toxocara canis]|uniref:G_PROTEIN_RECEP_F3_4 domain-containing protein n=1 Tax=Toxocara canis TaxID=6265 RepID=A0A183VDW2_TOXCA|nr:unnamed protein product [Toxocara canis]